jgi:hypothetical protein
MANISSNKKNELLLEENQVILKINQNVKNAKNVKDDKECIR